MKQINILGSALTLSLQKRGDGIFCLALLPHQVGLPSCAFELFKGGRIIPNSIKKAGSTISFKAHPFPKVNVPGHGVLELQVSCSLNRDSLCFTLELEAPPSYPMDELAVPGPCKLVGNTECFSDWHFLIPQREGLILPADRPDTQLGQINFWDSSLPMMALMKKPFATGTALLVLAHQGHDHALRPIIAANGEGPGFELVQAPALGRWGYRRTWRVTYIPSGGLSALAAEVRSEIARMGVSIPTLSEKLSNCGVPKTLHGSVGGTHLWWHSTPIPPSLVRNLRSAGLKSVVLLGRVASGSKTISDATAAGYAVAPYFQTYDVFPPGFGKELEWRGTYPPEGATYGWPKQLIRDMQGWYEKGWTHLPCKTTKPYWQMRPFLDKNGKLASRAVAVHREYITSTQRRCPLFHAEAFRKFALPMLSKNGYTGVFSDILTAMPGRECYDREHLCDRRADIESRRKVFAAGLKSNRIFFSEGGRWWALDQAHGFEGVLSIGDENINNITLTDYPFDADWYETQFNLELRVPFFGMVARHSVTRTLWWGHGQDRHRQTWDAKNALCALFGGNPIYVVDPTHPLQPGSKRWAKFVSGARAFDILRAATWGMELVGYQTFDRHLAQSTFANGVRVRANTGPVPAEGMAAGSFSIFSESGKRLGGT